MIPEALKIDFNHLYVTQMKTLLQVFLNAGIRAKIDLYICWDAVDLLN